MGGQDMSTAIHEASHAAAALTLGRPVDWVWRTDGLELNGDVVGQCRSPLRGRRIEASQVVIALAGYWSEREPNWPPSWPDAREEKREALGFVLAELRATEQIYQDLVEITRDMLADPDFIRLRDAIARALRHVPRLEREDIEALARIHLPDREEQTCST